jgi:hypothetical protein
LIDLGFDSRFFTRDFESTLGVEIKKYEFLILKEDVDKAIKLTRLTGRKSKAPYRNAVPLYVEAVLQRAFVMACAYAELLDLLLPGHETSEDSIVWMTQKYFTYGLCQRMEKMLKYHTAYILARSMENTGPDRPSFFDWVEKDGCFLPVQLMRKVYLRTVLRRKDSDVQLAYSLYQGKKASLPVLDSQVDEALEKNFKALTDESCEDDSSDELIRQVRRTVRECFNTSRDAGRKVDNKSYRLPTLSACFEQSRRQGGCFDKILKCSEFMPGEPFLLRIVEYKGKTVEIYVPTDPEDLSDLLGPDYDLPEELFVRRNAILEPFKVRIVSMGDSKYYQHARRFQRAMWETLQGCKAFELTGKPISSSVIGDILGEARDGFAKNIYSIFVSADYEAATDNLKKLYSEAALDEWCSCAKVSLEDQLVLRRSLTGHTIVDEKLSGTIKCPQKRGQLMGSPVSFPILNFINAAICRYAQEKAYGVEIELGKGHRFNGDDAGFLLPPAFYSKWIELVTKVGLKPSIGKNYVSRDYAVLNSAIYKLPEDWDRKVVTPTPLPYVRLNLLHLTGNCQLDLDRYNFQEEQENIGAKSLKLVEDFDEEMKSKLIERMIGYVNRLTQTGIIPPVSYFLPECVGGLGMYCPKDRISRISDHHLKIAAVIDCFDIDKKLEIQRNTWTCKPLPTYTRLAMAASRDLDKEFDYPLIDVHSAILPELKEVNKCPYFLDLLLGYSRYGCDFEEINSDSLLPRWHRWYWKMSKLARSTSLHAMSVDKALELGRFKRVRAYFL